MDLTGNTIFVPGATSGIGLGLALQLRERGTTARALRAEVPADRQSGVRSR